MRGKSLLIGSLALFLGACSSKGGGSHAPPPFQKEWLSGKWNNISEAQFLVGYNFSNDGTVKMMLKGIKNPISGRYTWINERTVDTEYEVATDVQQAYETAAKAYKQKVKELIKNKELTDKAGPPMLAMVADKLPAKETLTVGISEADQRWLILTRENGTSQTFKKAD